MTEQEQTNENQQPNIKFTMPNHKQRRTMMKQNGYFRAKKDIGYKEEIDLREARRENGRKIHEANLDEKERSLAIAFEEKIEKMKKSWIEMGYNNEEIEVLEEAYSLDFVNNKETRKQDKKLIRQLLKQANESRQKRNA